MKKLAILFSLFTLLLLATPTFAWSGVSGAVYDAYGAPWQHGFTIYMIGTVDGVPNQLLNGDGTVIPAGQHTFRVLFSTSPDNNTAVSLLIRFNDGGNGRPPYQSFPDLFMQSRETRSYFPMDNISTNTGPTVINLQSAGATPNSLPGFVASLFAVLLLLTYVKIQRRSG